MSVEDPFFTVKEDIEQLLLHAQDLYNRHSQVSNDLSATNQEQEWLLTELRNSLRSVEWDLEDLEETVKIVELNPSKFKISPSILRDRRRFIGDSKNLIQDIRAKMASADTRFQDRHAFTHSAAANAGGYKYSRLLEADNQSPTSTSRQFVSDTLEQQQLIMRRQDDDLEKVGDSVHVLKTMSTQIGNELDEQAVMLDDLGRDIDRTDSKLDTVMKKLAKVTHMSDDKRQWCAIAVLIVVLVVVILLFFL